MKFSMIFMLLMLVFMSSAFASNSEVTFEDNPAITGFTGPVESPQVTETDDNPLAPIHIVTFLPIANEEVGLIIKKPHPADPMVALALTSTAIGNGFGRVNSDKNNLS